MIPSGSVTVHPSPPGSVSFVGDSNHISLGLDAGQVAALVDERLAHVLREVVEHYQAQLAQLRTRIAQLEAAQITPPPARGTAIPRATAGPWPAEHVTAELVAAYATPNRMETL